MFKIKLSGQKRPKGGSTKLYYFGMKGKEPVAVTSSQKDLIKVYKTKAAATKAFHFAKTSFPESKPGIVEF